MFSRNGVFLLFFSLHLIYFSGAQGHSLRSGSSGISGILCVSRNGVFLQSKTESYNNYLNTALWIKIAYDMPVISRFYGIVIKMFFKPKEHEPAHIHAIYDEYVGIFDIHTYEMTMGDLPLQAQRLVKEWLRTNGPALIEMWNTQIIKQLPPLK